MPTNSERLDAIRKRLETGWGTNTRSDISFLLDSLTRAEGENAELTRRVVVLEGCHASKDTHSIDCAMDQKQRGTWGKNQ